MEQEEYEEAMKQYALANESRKNASENAQYYLEDKERGLAEIQLEVDSIKSDVYHLLRQDRIVVDQSSQRSNWEPIKEEDRTLTDWGVDRIMQTVHFVINRNNLLTNFDEDQIKMIMLDIMGELNDLFLQKYEFLFREPTFNECKQLILKKIEDKKAIKMFAGEMLGVKLDEEKVEKELLNEVQKNIEKEILILKREKRKDKIREYGLLINELKVIMYSALNRAYRGEERGSMRRHTQISELIGNPRPQQTKQGVFSWGQK